MEVSGVDSRSDRFNPNANRIGRWIVPRDGRDARGQKILCRESNPDSRVRSQYVTDVMSIRLLSLNFSSRNLAILMYVTSFLFPVQVSSRFDKQSQCEGHKKRLRF